MKAEKTASIRVYLRYQHELDRKIYTRMKVDASRGRALSEIARDALAAYYFPPTPKPEIQELTTTIEALSAQVAALAAQIAALANQVHEKDRLQAENAQLKLHLLSSTFGDRSMKRAASEAAQAIANNK